MVTTVLEDLGRALATLIRLKPYSEALARDLDGVDVDMLLQSFPIELVDNINEANSITHSAPFHADEPFATAMISLVFDVKLYRTRNQELIKSIIDEGNPRDLTIYDIGKVYDLYRGLFDHHQNDNGSGKLYRPDGTKYSSAGLIWKLYAPAIVHNVNKGELPSAVKSFVIERVDQQLVHEIDAFDNGQASPSDKLSICEIIQHLNPCWNEKGETPFINDENEKDDSMVFLVACYIARCILEREIANAIAVGLGVAVIEGQIEESENHVMVMDTLIDGWQEAIWASTNPKAEDIFFVVYPGESENEWNVQAVPPGPEDKWGQRKPFPTSWRGLPTDELKEKTTVGTAYFCHPGGFFAKAQTEDDAIALGELAAITE